MDVRDEVGQEQVADLASAGLVELDVVVRRAVEADHATADPFGIAQVVQPSDNLVLPFGLASSTSLNSALAAFTNLSSSSRSLMRRRAWAKRSAS